MKGRVKDGAKIGYFHQSPNRRCCSLPVGGHGQQDTEYHSQQRGEQYPCVARQQERYRVGRVPEKRYCFLENEVPLSVPVESGERVAHVQRGEETAERSARSEYVGVGHFVECHEYGSEDGVHGHRYATCDEHFLPRQRQGHRCRGVFHAERGEEDRDSRGEYRHGHADAHTENAPHQRTWCNAETGAVVNPVGYPESDAFAESGEQGEFDETHHHSMLCVELFVEFVHGREQEEGGEQREGADDDDEVFSLHGLAVVVRVQGRVGVRFPVRKGSEIIRTGTVSSRNLRQAGRIEGLYARRDAACVSPRIFRFAEPVYSSPAAFMYSDRLMASFARAAMYSAEAFCHIAWASR